MTEKQYLQVFQTLTKCIFTVLTGQAAVFLTMTYSLLTGPEGGLEEKEVQQAMEAGLQVCTLGRRILRCETAPLCALSAVMYASGDF